MTAMKRGWWVVLDELNLAEPQILERLNPVLERHPGARALGARQHGDWVARRARASRVPDFRHHEPRRVRRVAPRYPPRTETAGVPTATCSHLAKASTSRCCGSSSRASSPTWRWEASAIAACSRPRRWPSWPRSRRRRQLPSSAGPVPRCARRGGGSQARRRLPARGSAARALRVLEARAARRDGLSRARH